MNTRVGLLSAGALVFLALAALLVIAAVTAVGPWKDLQNVYGTPARADMAGSKLKQTLIIRLEPSRSPTAYHGIVSTLITPSGMFLRLDRPFGIFLGDLFIPRAAVAECSVSHWSAGTESNLRLSTPRALISVSDPQEVLQSWCP